MYMAMVYMEKQLYEGKLKGRVWRTIYGRKRETICPYGMKWKSIEKNVGELDTFKNQHIGWATVTCWVDQV